MVYPWFTLLLTLITCDKLNTDGEMAVRRYAMNLWHMFNPMLVKSYFVKLSNPEAPPFIALKQLSISLKVIGDMLSDI